MKIFHKTTAILLLLCCMLQAAAQLPANKTSKDYFFLKGAVKSVRGTINKASEKDGAIQQGEMIRGYTYLFNTQQQLIEHLFSNKTGVLKKIKYHYNSDGKMVDEQTEKKSGSREKKIVYQYRGTQLVESYTADATDKKVAQVNFFYTDQNLLSQEDYYNGDSLLSYSLIYHYDANKNLLKIEHKEKQISFDTKVYIYNKQGKIAEEKIYTQPDDLLFHYRYRYDAQGNIAEKSVIRLNGEVSRTYVYTYDQHNSLLEESWYDQNSTLLLYKEAYSYNYDEEGNWIVKMKYEGKDLVLKSIETRVISYR